MSAYQCTEERFLKDVSNHTMKVLQDNGVFRCLRFDHDGSFNMYFNLTTWPGYLCISGDMGAFVFNRLEDMFQFFRIKPNADDRKETLPINPGYWGEKCEAEDRRTHGMSTFCIETFTESVMDRFNSHFGEEDADQKSKAECLEALKEQVLDAENTFEAYQKAYEFEFEGYQLLDEFHDCHIEAYTYDFIWCLYAIAWGIQQYDAAKVKEAQL
jgi:hypothetical protein